jgi:hypothetical protein
VSVGRRHWVLWFVWFIYITVGAGSSRRGQLNRMGEGAYGSEALRTRNTKVTHRTPGLWYFWDIRYVLLTAQLDTCVSWNQLDALFIFSLFSHYTCTCFGLASCPSSGGNNVYMWQLVCVVHLSPLAHTTRTSCHTYTLLPPDDGQLASPKHVGV